MSAWERLLSRMPMRMRRALEEGDLGIVVRALCVELDETAGLVNGLVAAAAKEGIAACPHDVGTRGGVCELCGEET